MKIKYFTTYGKDFGHLGVNFYSCLFKLDDDKTFFLTRDDNLIFGKDSFARFETREEALQETIKSYIANSSNVL